MVVEAPTSTASSTPSGLSAEGVVKLKAEKAKAAAFAKSVVNTESYKFVAASSFGKRLHRRGWCTL